MEAEVNVFLKCLSCGTFVTSSSVAVIRTHLEKCLVSKGDDYSTARHSVDNVDELGADSDDFISYQTQSFTFTQPSVVLVSCSLERSNLELELEHGLDDDDTSLALVPRAERKKRQNKRKRAPNKSHLEAIKKPKLCRVTQLETTKEPEPAFIVNTHKHVGRVGETFTCSICYRKLKHRHGPAGLHGHLNQHQEAEALENKFNLWTQWPTQPNRKNGQKAYSCKYCLTKLTNNPDFLSHMTIDHSDKMEHSSFSCPYYCFAQLDSISDLIAHFKSSHPREYFGPSIQSEEHSDSYSCAYPGCEMKCQNVHILKRHFILHLENCPYVCNFPGCSVKCGSAYDLKRHIKRKHLDAPVTCTKCGVTSVNTETLKRHDCNANMKKIQSGYYELVEIEGFFKLRLVEDKKGNGVKSELDPKPISAASEVKFGLTDKVEEYVESLKHININAIIRSDPGFTQACENSPGFGEILLGNQLLGEKFQPFQKRRSQTLKCSKCGTTFTGRHGYNKHVADCTATGGNSKGSYSTKVSPEEKHLHIGCPTCGKSFENEQILEEHLAQDHSPNEVFKCEAPGCGKYFHSKVSKQQHYQRLHVHQPYQCENCRVCFKSQLRLYKHMEGHLTNPNLGANKTLQCLCEVCGKTFANLYCRNTHIKKMHGITVPLPVAELQPKKNVKNKKQNTATIGSKAISNFPKFEVNTEKAIVQVKIEPDLIISDDLHNYDLIVKQEIN